MKTIWLIRHAKSSWADASLPDHDRPLKKRGRKDAKCIGMFLNQQLQSRQQQQQQQQQQQNSISNKNNNNNNNGTTPLLILCSSAERTKETLQIVLEHIDESVGKQSFKIRLDKRLYEASSERILQVLSELNDEEAGDEIVLVGHNPGLEDLIGELVGEYHEMPTAGLIQIALRGIETWKDINKAAIDSTGKVQVHTTGKRLREACAFETDIDR